MSCISLYTTFEGEFDVKLANDQASSRYHVEMYTDYDEILEHGTSTLLLFAA